MAIGRRRTVLRDADEVPRDQVLTRIVDLDAERVVAREMFPAPAAVPPIVFPVA